MLRLGSFIFIFLFIVSTYGFTKDQDCLFLEKPCLTCASCTDAWLTLDAKVGYFFFSDAKMRKVYDQGGLDLQVSGAFPICRGWLQVYSSIEYLERHGRSLRGKQKAKIWEIPLSLGLRSVFPIYQQVQYFITIGPRYFFVQAHNDSSYVERNMSENGLGGFANTGFKFFPCANLSLDIFGEYSYGRLHFHSSKHNSYGQTVQVGGFTFGAGLGYAF